MKIVSHLSEKILNFFEKLHNIRNTTSFRLNNFLVNMGLFEGLTVMKMKYRSAFSLYGERFLIYWALRLFEWPKHIFVLTDMTLTYKESFVNFSARTLRT